MSLKDKALIVSVKKSRWGATRQNKEVSEEVTRSKGANDGAGYWVDYLIDIKHPAFAAVTKAYGDIDRFHKKLTLPWDDKLRRLLASRLYPEHSAGMKQRIKAANKAVAALASVFPQMVEEARKRRGPMFDPNDYPSTTDLIDRHVITVEVDPFPNVSEDFRTTLTDADFRAAQARAEEKIAKSLEEVWMRAAEAVGKIAERLKDPDKKFRNSLITNVQELARLLPDLNIAGDPALDEMADRINRELLAHEPQMLRDNHEARKKTAESADDILAAMAGYTGVVNEDKEAA